ncbi:diguanylate cyclase domain-containing protein [Rhizobium sp. 'Codium 1']|uniref:diguanylate cyclase domain-containing protein n=1 Tax=Rhizobium sp. 'Codium 1' TaxID=2940484 RepID=UPI001E4F6ED8|nr:diguanylate cyclase [Rhizobium sp. 'Codium 1']MCC8933744.1 diguanylate cyclase [Rhizobium sp. 'Codium 1']
MSGLAEDLQKVTAFMLKHQIAGLPRNFELVHEAFTAGNLELARELAALGTRPPQMALDQLGLKHRISAHCGVSAERLQDETLKTLTRMSNHLSLGLTQKRAFTNSVEGVIRSIREDESIGINQLLGELNLLSSIATDMIKAETALSSEVAEGLESLISADRGIRAAQAAMNRDHLTGLANRISLLQKLEEAHAEASAAKPSALVLIEILDHSGLKQQYGDEAVSKLIRGLAGIFRKAIKKHDVIARIEADTFAFVFDGINADEAHIIAERLFTTAENNLVFASATSQNAGGLPLAIGHAMAHEAPDPTSWLAIAKTATMLARQNPRQPIIGHKPGKRNVA